MLLASPKHKTMLTQNHNTYMLAILPTNPALGTLQYLKNKITHCLVEPTYCSTPYIKITEPFNWDGTAEYLLVHEVKSIVAQCFSTPIELTNCSINTTAYELLIDIEANEDLERMRHLFCMQLLKEQYQDNHPYALILANGDLKSGHLQTAYNSIKNQPVNTLFHADKIQLMEKQNQVWVSKYTFDLE